MNTLKSSHSDVIFGLVSLISLSLLHCSQPLFYRKGSSEKQKDGKGKCFSYKKNMLLSTSPKLSHVYFYYWAQCTYDSFLYKLNFNKFLSLYQDVGNEKSTCFVKFSLLPSVYQVHQRYHVFRQKNYSSMLLY